MFDSAAIIRSLTNAGLSQEQARTIVATLQTTVDDMVHKPSSHAVADAKEQLGLDLVVELVEARYHRKRVVFHRWLVGILIAPFAVTTYILDAHLESAIAQIELAALRGQVEIGTATETSVAEIRAAKQTVDDHPTDAEVVVAQPDAILQLGRLSTVEMDGKNKSFRITNIEQQGNYCIDAIAETPDFDPVIYLYNSSEFSVGSLIDFNDDRDDASSLNSRICSVLETDSTYYLEVAELVDRSGTVVLFFDRDDAE